MDECDFAKLSNATPRCVITCLCYYRRDFEVENVHYVKKMKIPEFLEVVS